MKITTQFTGKFAGALEELVDTEELHISLSAVSDPVAVLRNEQSGEEIQVLFTGHEGDPTIGTVLYSRRIEGIDDLPNLDYTKIDEFSLQATIGEAMTLTTLYEQSKSKGVRSQTGARNTFRTNMKSEKFLNAALITVSSFSDSSEIAREVHYAIRDGLEADQDFNSSFRAIYDSVMDQDPEKFSMQVITPRDDNGYQAIIRLEYKDGRHVLILQEEAQAGTYDSTFMDRCFETAKWESIEGRVEDFTSVYIPSPPENDAKAKDQEKSKDNKKRRWSLLDWALAIGAGTLIATYAMKDGGCKAQAAALPNTYDQGGILSPHESEQGYNMIRVNED